MPSRVNTKQPQSVRRPIRIAFLSMLTVTLLHGRVDADEAINFNRDIRPILSDRCFACHGPDKNARKADLRLDQRQVAVDVGAIAPGDVSKSKLVERIFSTDPDVMMPPPKHNMPLTAMMQNVTVWQDFLAGSSDTH